MFFVELDHLVLVPHRLLLGPLLGLLGRALPDTLLAEADVLVDLQGLQVGGLVAYPRAVDVLLGRVLHEEHEHLAELLVPGDFEEEGVVVLLAPEEGAHGRLEAVARGTVLIQPLLEEGDDILDDVLPVPAFMKVQLFLDIFFHLFTLPLFWIFTGF